MQISIFSHSVQVLLPEREGPMRVTFLALVIGGAVRQVARRAILAVVVVRVAAGAVEAVAAVARGALVVVGAVLLLCAQIAVGAGLCWIRVCY